MKERKPPEWTVPVVGLMHKHRISKTDLAGELRVKKNYVGMVLNGEREPKSGACTQEAIEDAVDRLIEKRKEGGV